MRTKNFFSITLPAALFTMCVFSATTARAASSDSPSDTNDSRLVMGLQVAYGQENGIPINVSHIEILFAQPQIGIAAWRFPNSPIPFKEFEVISEGIIGGGIHPTGHLFGDTLLFRLVGNTSRKVAPFLDIGSGPLHTGLQVWELGGHVQFLSKGGGGVLYKLDEHRALVFEYCYFHMSNARLAVPNHGFDASMVSVGMRWARH